MSAQQQREQDASDYAEAEARRSGQSNRDDVHHGIPRIPAGSADRGEAA